MSQCLICLKRNNVKNMGVCGVVVAFSGFGGAQVRQSDIVSQSLSHACTALTLAAESYSDPTRSS